MWGVVVAVSAACAAVAAVDLAVVAVGKDWQEIRRGAASAILLCCCVACGYVVVGVDFGGGGMDWTKISSAVER